MKDRKNFQDLQLFDEECEVVVLSLLLSVKGALDEVRELLTLDCFYIEKHRDIYQSILNVANKGDEININSSLKIRHA